MAGIKGRSGRRKFSIEYERAKLKDNTINKSYRIIDSKLSQENPDKQTVSIASGIVLKDLSNDKKSPEITHNQNKLYINYINLPLLNTALEKIKSLQGKEEGKGIIDVSNTIPNTDLEINQNPSPTQVIDISNASNREDDI